MIEYNGIDIPEDWIREAYRQLPVEVPADPNGIVIVCDGCGKTTNDISKEIPFGAKEAGEFEQIDESGVPKWTCRDCLDKRVGGRDG